MRRSPIRRRVGLKSRVDLKRTKPPRRRSKKGDAEARLRQEVYAWLEEHTDGRCANCGRPLGWYFMGFEMVHKIPLGRGGKTTRENCEFWCWPCHYGPPGPHHTLSERLYNELTTAYDSKVGLRRKEG